MLYLLIGLSAISLPYLIHIFLYYLYARYDRPHFRVPLHPRKVLKINKAVVSSVFGDLQLVPLFIRLTLHYRNSLVIKKDILYGTHGQKLDIYENATDKESKGVIIFIYGGAWVSGDKNLYSLIGRNLSEDGFDVVIPNYSLYPTKKVDTMVEQIEQVIEEIKKTNLFSKDQKNRKKLMYIVGHSAGAHLSALTLINSHLKESKDESSDYRVAGFIGMSGVYNIVNHYEYESMRGVEELSGMGRAMGDSVENFNSNSPSCILGQHFSNKTFPSNPFPKVLLLHGQEDATVPVSSSIELHDSFQKLQVRSHLKVIKANHIDFAIGLMEKKHKLHSYLLQEINEFCQ